MQESLAPGEASRWGEAVGNIEDARVALDTLARAIEDAVYLDEDAYNQVAPVMQYQRASQVLCYPLLPSCTMLQYIHVISSKVCQRNNTSCPVRFVKATTQAVKQLGLIHDTAETLILKLHAHTTESSQGEC